MEEHGTQDFWHWTATTATALIVGLLLFVLKSLGLRIERLEDTSGAISGRLSRIEATLEQVHKTVSKRDDQAHDGYQRLATLEEISNENKQAIRDGRTEVAEIRDLIIEMKSNRKS